MADVLISSSRCAPSNWRPLSTDEECRKQASEILGAHFADWLSRFVGEGWDSQEAARLLFVTAQADHDGYKLARRLEDGFAINPNPELVDLLDEWVPTLEKVTQKIELHKAKEAKIEPPFAVAACAIFHDQQHGPISGTAFRIPHNKVGVVAFVADGAVFDKETGDLIVTRVGLEDLEVTGTSSPRDDNLRVSVLSRIEDEDGIANLDELARIADVDIGQYDVHAAELATDREDAGASVMDAYVEVIDELGDAFRQALEDQNDEDIWIAGLLLSSTYRRLTMLAGQPRENADGVKDFLRRLEGGQEETSSVVESIDRAAATLH